MKRQKHLGVWFKPSYAKGFMLLGGYAKNYLTYFCKLKLSSFIWNQLSLSLMANKSSWQIDGETMETVRDFIFLGSKITHCRWCLQPWNQKMLAPWKKAVTNLDSILKNGDIILPTEVYLVKAVVFPGVMHGCESWTIKVSTEELMLLNCGIGEDSWVCWTARKSTLSVLKEINPEYSSEGLMLKLKV